MPIVHVHIMTGRTPEQKADLGVRITNAVCEALLARPESVRVLIQEHVEGEWFAGGKPVPAGKPPSTG